MALKFEVQDGGKTIEVSVSGTLTRDDYSHFVPEVEKMVQQHGKIRVLLAMHDLHGWKAGALWEDLKFDLKHFNDIDRLALVGEKKWQKGMATFCRPFTTAKIRYFGQDQAEHARQWLKEP